MGFFKKKSKEEELYDANQEVKSFCKGKKDLNEKEHKKLNKLIEKRANAASDVLGVKIGSISYEDAKKFREKMGK